MVTFRLNIDLGNDSMKTTNDIARALANIAVKMLDQDINNFVLYQTIFDDNGNDVGRYGIKDDNGNIPRYPLTFEE